MRQIRVLSLGEGTGPRRRVLVTFSVTFDKHLRCDGTNFSDAKETENNLHLFDKTSHLICNDAVHTARTLSSDTLSMLEHAKEYAILLTDERQRRCAHYSAEMRGKSYDVALVLDLDRDIHNLPSWLDSCSLEFRNGHHCGVSNWPRDGFVVSRFDNVDDDDDRSLVATHLARSMRHRTCTHHLHPIVSVGPPRGTRVMRNKTGITRDEWSAILEFMHRTTSSAVASLSTGTTTTSTGRHLLSIETPDQVGEPEEKRTTKPSLSKKMEKAVSTFVEVSGRLKSMIEAGERVREGTIFEVIINPLTNAFSAMMPEVIWWISKEIIVAVIEYILEQMVFPVFTEPTLSKLVPASGGSLPLFKRRQRKKKKGKTCVKDRTIECETDEECGDKAPCDTGKTCSKDRSIKCKTDEECDDKAPCDTGKTCTCARQTECLEDTACGEKGPCNTGKTCSEKRTKPCDDDGDCANDEGSCDSGKTCSIDRSIACEFDEDCGGKGKNGECTTGKTCSGDRTRECSIDVECSCDGNGVCNDGKGKTCVKDRTIECETDEECGDKAPCDTGKTCSKDRSIKCKTDEECDDKAPCDTGKTCTCARQTECLEDTACGEKGPCNTGKTCSEKRTKPCDDDGDCANDEGSCDSGKTCSIDRSIACEFDEDCGGKGKNGECTTGKTCSGDRTRECSFDAECSCDGNGVCNDGDGNYDKGKTCMKDRTIECETDEECGDKAPCDAAWHRSVVRPRNQNRSVEIFPQNASPGDGFVPAGMAFGHGDVGQGNASKTGFVGPLDCEEDGCRTIESVPKKTSTSNGPPQPDVDLPRESVFLETQFVGEQKKPDQAARPGGLPHKLTIAITDVVVDDLASAIYRKFDDMLGSKVRKAVVRSSTRSLTRKLSANLGVSLTRTLIELLSLSMTAVPTRRLVSGLVPSLTASLTTIITRAVARDPKADYYCHYCLLHGAYCDPCHRSMEIERFRDEIGAHYGQYYSSYYTAFYSAQGADAASRNYFSRAKLEGTRGLQDGP
eukprot:g2192.t1